HEAERGRDIRGVGAVHGFEMCERFGWLFRRECDRAQVVMSSRIAGIQFQHLFKGPRRIGQAFLLKIRGPQISVGTEVLWGERYRSQEMLFGLGEIGTRRCYEAQQQFGVRKARIERKCLGSSLSSLVPTLLFE